MRKWEQSVSPDGSTLVLKPMGRDNRSLKQRVPVAPHNGDLSPQKPLNHHILKIPRNWPDKSGSKIEGYLLIGQKTQPSTTTGFHM